MKKINRRSFLGGLLATGSVAGLAGCKGFPSIVSSRSPNGKLCHACIGTGNMAWGDLHELKSHKQLEIVALCDVDADYLAAAKKVVPGARVYRDWRELLVAEGDRIDSVNVSTPDHMHTSIAAGALRAGKNVYCQKPLCRRLDENVYLKNLAAEAGVVTQLGTQVAAWKSDRIAVKLIAEGVVGPVKRVVMFSNREHGRTRTVSPAEPAPAKLAWNLWLGTAASRPYAEGYHPRAWRSWSDFGSGWIGDLCIHIISAPWFGLGLSTVPPNAVRADVNAEALTDPAFKGRWPLYSHITWEFPGIDGSGGRPFTLEWLDGFAAAPSSSEAFLPPQTYRALLAGTPMKEFPLEGRVVEGEDGWIIVPHCAKYPLPVVVMKNGTHPTVPDVPDVPTHYHEYVNCCLNGGVARSDFSRISSMMDAVLMGCVAEQLPGRRLKWNAATRTFDDPAANVLSTSVYRDGWRLPGLG